MLLRPSVRPLARIAVAHHQRLRAFAASIGFTIDRRCSRGASSVSAAQPRSRPSPLVAPAPGTDASGGASEVAQLLELAVGWRKIVLAEREYAKSLAIPKSSFQKLGRVLTQLELALPRISAVLGESPTSHSTALAKELSMLCSALAKERLSFPHVAALPVHTLLSVLVALLQIPPEHARLRNLELESLWSACLF